jgi:lipid A ethanolaminephosphotransferase
VLQRRITISAPLLSGFTCVIFLALYNFSFWQQLSKYVSGPFLLAMALFAFTGMYAVLSIFTTKYTYKPLLILGVLVAAVSAYAMDHYGFVVSEHAFRNLAETDANEFFDLMHSHCLLFLAISFVLPTILILYTKVSYPPSKIILLNVFISGLLCVGNVMLFSRYYAELLRNNRQVRHYLNPALPLYSMIKYGIKNTWPKVAPEFLILDENPMRKNIATGNKSKPKVVVLVIGESDRSINHSLNGYKKNTDQLLGLRNDVYSFSNFSSCGTETVVSVPCMFSAFTRKDYSDAKGRYTQNVLDLLQQAQVQVLWRDNDGGCKHVCDRVAVEDFNQAKLKPYCNAVECYDEILIDNLQQILQNEESDKLIVLHKKGNHGPAYYKRYPKEFEKFTPICASKSFSSCTDEQIVNTYDNIILYTDYMLNRIIEELEQHTAKYQSAMIYVADHGESLGEKGVYSHAMPYWLAPKEQTHVPFIFWASKDFTIDRTQLHKLQNQELSHDNIFHTLLGLFNVHSSTYVAELDMFN